MRVALTVTLAVLVGVVAANADPKDSAKILSGEMADCFAYFTISQQCGQHIDQAQIDRLGDLAFLTGKLAGLEDNVVGARYLETITKLAAEMQNSCDGFRALTKRYDVACLSLLENPEKRANELRAR
jgi:hypothetical protein